MACRERIHTRRRAGVERTFMTAPLAEEFRDRSRVRITYDCEEIAAVIFRTRVMPRCLLTSLIVPLVVQRQTLADFVEGRTICDPSTRAPRYALPSGEFLYRGTARLRDVHEGKTRGCRMR